MRTFRVGTWVCLLIEAAERILNCRVVPYQTASNDRVWEVLPALQSWGGVWTQPPRRGVAPECLLSPLAAS